MSMRLSRRTLLRGLLGSTVVSIGLPPLDIFFNGNGTAYAAGTPFPLRFGLFFWGNGIRPEKWIPKGEGAGAAWELSEELAPLANLKNYLTVVSGLKVEIPNRVPHWSGAAGILTAVPGGDKDTNITMYGPTIDQVIAQGLDKQGQFTRFKSLEYGAEAGGGISYNGPDSQNPAESSPRAFFERVFTEGFRPPGDASGPDPKLALRRSVLDAVLDQGASLKQKLGTTDRQRLQQHFDGIRDLEKRIEFIENNPITLDACVAPANPEVDSYPDIDGHPQLTAANRALNDVARMALACDQTRVFSNWLTRPVNNLLFEGATAGHHQLTHDEPGAQPQVHAIVLKMITELASTLESLKAIPEGDATLLDHCLVFATSDVSEGRVHALDEFPIVLAGGANGRLKMDYHYRSPTQESATKLLIALQQAMGMTITEFGKDEGHAKGALDAIFV